MELWQSIVIQKNQVLLFTQLLRNISLYDRHTKGREKYASLYLAWLDYIRSFTFKSQQTRGTLATLAFLLGRHGSTILPETQRTRIASVLHAVQEAVQSEMAGHIESIEMDPLVPNSEIPSDDVALYHISGWALKSTIDYREKCLGSRFCYTSAA